MVSGAAAPEPATSHVGPIQLRFRWGAAKGRHNRNPSTRSLRFPGLTATTPRTWAECNLVAIAWVDVGSPAAATQYYISIEYGRPELVFDHS